MTIKVGDKLPAGTLYEFIEDETPGCTVGPNAFEVEKLIAGKKIAIFGLPGAFTPTCSAKHVPGYVQNFDKLKAAGIDEADASRGRLSWISPLARALLKHREGDQIVFKAPGGDQVLDVVAVEYRELS